MKLAYTYLSRQFRPRIPCRNLRRSARQVVTLADRAFVESPAKESLENTISITGICNALSERLVLGVRVCDTPRICHIVLD